MKRDKRGQLTLFIIIAIALVILIIYFYYNSNIINTEKYHPKVEILNKNVLDCYEKSFEEALIVVGLQGGYFEVPEPKEVMISSYLSIEVPYYYQKKDLYTPSLEKIENEIKKVSELAVMYCNEEYKKDQEYDSIEFNIEKIIVNIYEKNVKFTPKITMNVIYEEKATKIDFSKKPILIDSDIYNMHKIALFISERYVTNNEWTEFSEIVDFSNRLDLYIDIKDSTDGEENSISILTQKEDYYPKIYQFKNKFSHENLSDIEPLL
jgi:hypothetical protein